MTTRTSSPTLSAMHSEGQGAAAHSMLGASRASSTHPSFPNHRHMETARSPSPNSAAQHQAYMTGEAGSSSTPWGPARRQPNGPYTGSAPVVPPGLFPQSISPGAMEPFLGYNELFGSGSAGSSRHQQELSDGDGRLMKPSDMAEQLARMDLHGLADSNGPPRNNEGYGLPQRTSQAQGYPGVPASGSLSPRSLLHLHHQQLQAQHAMALQAAQNAAAHGSNPSMQEEITTVFIVGFPDDMTEREFANMFLFAKGFEASTLKIPAGGFTTGASQREGSISGPSGPYHSVQMQGIGGQGGSSGGWDDQTVSMTLARAGQHDNFSQLNNSLNPNGQNQQVGKIKQIIGFAKFRTRQDALEARDALNGRKIDAERGCVLKTEMAKKNLHTKQRPSIIPGSKTPGTEGPYGPSGSYPTSASDREPPPPANYGGYSRTPTGGASMTQTSQPGFANLPAGAPPQLLAQHEAILRQAEMLRQPGGNQGGAQNSEQQGGSQQERWAPLGPLDYYSDEQGQGRSQGQHQSSSRSDWGSVASPPQFHAQIRPAPTTGQYAAAAAAAAAPKPGQGTAGAVTRNRAGEDFGKGESRVELHPDDQRQDDVSSSRPTRGTAARPGPPGLGSPDLAHMNGFDRAPAPDESTPPSVQPRDIVNGNPRSQHSNSSASPPSSSDLPSPTNRGFVGDQNPPNTTLFVGNLPANLSAASSAQLEEKLRSLFSSRPGFRQMSYKLKGHGPMCFVEFESIIYAGNALNGVNGDSLGGLLKGHGIRLSFSKNPLFRHTNPTASPPSQPTVHTLNSAFKRSSADDAFDLDKLNSLEETAFGHGYAGGFSHGALHGKFEGRALGREKGFDVWGEVGYYQGMASVWQRLLTEGIPERERSQKQIKQLQQIDSLLDMTFSFPTRNDSSNAQNARSDDGAPDLSQQLERIRGRYKLVAASLGLQSQGPPGLNGPNQPQLGEVGGRLVDTSQLRY